MVIEVITDTSSGVAVVRIATESLVVGNADAFRAKMSPLMVEDCRIVMDMSGVRFIDSSGIGALLSCLKKIQALGGHLSFCCLTDQVQSILKLVRVDKLLSVFATREEAIRSLEH